MMNFKHISLLAAALAMLALGGCKKPEQGQEQGQGQEQEQPKPTPTPVEVEGKITITTGPLDATVASAGGTVTIAFTTDKEWAAKTDASWLKLGASSGSKGENTLQVTVAAYDGYDDRTADVTITCGKDSKKLTVTQKAKDPEDNPGDNPGDDPTPTGETDDLACPTPPAVGTVDQTALVGYGAGVTGGEGSGSQVLHFNNGKALQTWLLQRTKDEKKGTHTPTVIWLSGTFKSDDGRDFSEAHPWFDVKDVSNLSFIGTDTFVMDKIGIFCVRANNIIIRNINFQQPKANNGADAVSMQDCDGVWVDHCTFTSLNQTKDYEDGSTDITHGSKNVTVSWCRYIKTQKSCLVGHSNSQSGDVAITATFHHNWFEGSSSRHPRVRFGTVHVYNNLFDGNTTYGVGSAYGAKVLVEYNYFDAVQLPTDICTYPAKDGGVSNLQGSVAGYLYPTQNVYVNKPAKAKSPYPLSNVKYTKYGGTAGAELTYADFKPAYSYTVTAAEDVPSVVKAGAGYGKLEGFASAPVPVDNGGITDFNGTDDNPGDEPGTPGTHLLYVGADKKIVDDTYFTHSESIADFSKDYSGSFTIDGTTYAYGLKMDSKGSVIFTTSSTLNTSVQFYFARRKADGTAKMQIIPDGGTAQEFDTPHETYADSGVLTLEKGTPYTIKQKSGEQALILVKVTETE
jgi:pectate lyase